LFFLEVIMATTAQRDKSRSAKVLMAAAREIEHTGMTARAPMDALIARAFVGGVALLPLTEREPTLKSLLAGLTKAIQEVAVPSDRVFIDPGMLRRRAALAASSRRTAQAPVSETAGLESDTPSATGVESDKAREATFAQAYTARKRLADKGELLSSAELAQRLQVSRQAINQRVGTGSLFFLDGPGGATYFPAFFADEKYEKRALRKVVRALEGQSGANKWLFFTSPRVSLGGLTPLDILAGKKPGAHAGLNAEERERIGIDSVLKAAAAFSEE
jgi:hypothetical protein